MTAKSRSTPLDLPPTKKLGVKLGTNAVTGVPARQLVADALNRAWRAFLQGMTIDIAVAVAALILTSTNLITGWAGLGVLGLAVVKTALQSAASYIMRRYVDRSTLIPSPLPPSDPKL